MLHLKKIFFLLLLFPFCLSGQLDLKSDHSYDELEVLLNQAREENDHQILADAYFLLAVYEKDKLSNDELAFEYFTRSLEYYKIVEDEEQIFEVERKIALRSLEAGLYTEAVESLEKMLMHYRKLGDKKMLTQLFMDLASAYIGTGDTEKALNYQKKAISLNREVGDEELSVKLSLTQVDSYVALTELDSASLLINRIVNRALKLENIELKCQVLNQQGEIRNLQKRHVRALESFTMAGSLCGSRPYDRNRLNLYQGLSRTYKKLADYKLAYSYTEKYAALNDSILNNDRVNTINNLSYKFKVKQKNKELRVLELENDYAFQKNNQQRRALWVLGGGLGLLLALLYYIIRFYNQRIKANSIINEQKEKINSQRFQNLEDEIKINSMQSMIEGQEIERERIAKELHDSLGGVLSTIKLQFDSVQSKIKKVAQVEEYQKAHKLIDAAVDEVRTISQNLQPSALENLGLIAAINDLINRFQGHKNAEIDFQHYSFPEKINKMVSLSIYRIVQELLNNASKHSKAEEIMIQLTRDEDEIVVHFEDDGIGFDPSHTRKGGMGMENIRSRVNYLKGSMSIDSKDGEGSSFVIHIPYVAD